MSGTTRSPLRWPKEVQLANAQTPSCLSSTHLAYSMPSVLAYLAKAKTPMTILNQRAARTTPQCRHGPHTHTPCGGPAMKHSLMNPSTLGPLFHIFRTLPYLALLCSSLGVGWPRSFRTNMDTRCQCFTDSFVSFGSGEPCLRRYSKASPRLTCRSSTEQTQRGLDRAVIAAEVKCSTGSAGELAMRHLESFMSCNSMLLTYSVTKG